MIKIIKNPEPQVLKEKKEEWTNRLQEYLQKNIEIPKSLSTKYNQTEVKDALKIECRNKCMYCESTISHIAYDHIEHIKPKAQNKFPELTFVWENLGLSCPICNNKKGSIYDADLPFINPYIDDPADFFIALGGIIKKKPANKRAELTLKILDLNRNELIEQRAERLKLIEKLIDRYCAETNNSLKEAILHEIQIEMRLLK